MYKTAQMEQFQIAYIQAMVAACGFNHSTPVVDDHSVDLDIFAQLPYDSKFPEQKCDPRVRLQLKATCGLTIKNNIASFILKKKNYDDLSANGNQDPRYLIILDLPKSVTKWLIHKKKFMALKNHCYWVSLKDFPKKKTKTTTVHFPITQHFTIDVLREMLQKARTGESYVQENQ